MSTEEILRIRRTLVAVLILALGLTGVFLATLSGTAASLPARDAPGIVDTDSGGSGYGRVSPDDMGYDGVSPDDMGYD